MAHETLMERVVPGPAYMPHDRGLGFPESAGEPRPESAAPTPGYYDVPMLKPPVWHDLISWYLFLGGLSGGAYVTARLAERFGGPRFRPLARIGTYVAAAAALPCAPLLIADLGDPKRFHHMLRVFKPESPMNLGAWVLTAYHGAGAAALAREWLHEKDVESEPNSKSLVARAGEGLLLAVADVAGIPMALLLSAYTGVLLSGTSNPAWAKSKWLPALFSASAMSSGSAAISLAQEALAATGVTVDSEASRPPMDTLNSVAHLAEVVTLVGYLSSPAAPRSPGSLAPSTWGSLAAIAGSELLSHLPVGSRTRPWIKIGSAALGLFAAYHIRSSLIKAGHTAANDPEIRL